MTRRRRTSRPCWMLRCTDPASSMMLPSLYTPHRFGMRDRPDAQENLDTHSHHSSALTNARDMVFIILCLGKRASKSDFVFILLHVFWGRRHERAGILSRCEKIRREMGVSHHVDHSSPLTYFLLLPLFALWLRRYPGTWLYIFGRRASWFSPLFLALGGNARS